MSPDIHAHVNLSLTAKALLQDTQEMINRVEKQIEAAESSATPSNSLQPVGTINVAKTPEGVLEFPKKQKDLYEELIAFTETFYHTHKSLPNQADFENNFSKKALPQNIEEWKEVLLQISPALEARGIAPYQTPSEYLEPNFILAVSLITNPHDTRSPAAKLKEANLSTKQWYALLKKPKCKEYYEKCLNEIFDEHAQNIAKVSVLRLMEQGDLQAIKHFHELKNIYRPHDSGKTVLLVLQAVMEILSKHVTGDILIKIGSELRNNPVIETTLKELGPVGE